MVARAFGELALGGDAAFAEDALRGVVNEAERMDSSAFGGDDVGSVVARDCFGHLTAHAIAHAHEKNFYRIGHGLRCVVCHAKELLVDGWISPQLGMKCEGKNFSLANEDGLAGVFCETL